MDEKKKTQKKSRRLLQVNWSSERLLEKFVLLFRADIYFTEIVELRARGNTEVNNILNSQEWGRNNYFGVWRNSKLTFVVKKAALGFYDWRILFASFIKIKAPSAKLSFFISEMA